MKVKKIAALIAASMLCLFNIGFVYAEETENSSSAQQETKISEDSLWQYTIQTNEETNEEYATIEKYLGHDKEITIPEEIDGNIVQELGKYAFYENVEITKVTISKNITDFGDFPFFGCSSLKEFEVNSENEIYESIDGVLFGENAQLFVCYPPAKSETEYTIPDGVLYLNPAAFACCTNLKKINFPDSLEKIELYCFAECTSLNDVVIPEKVDEIGNFNFTGCTALKNITLPDEMTRIGDGAFYSCTALDSITFPTYLTEIGQCAFVSTGLKEIEIPATVIDIGYSAFGFTTDQSGQLVAMDGFIVKGVEGSIAQKYCAEEGNENITFEAVENKTTQTTESKNNTKKNNGIKPGVIIGIMLCFAVAIVLPVSGVFIAKRKKSKKEE